MNRVQSLLSSDQGTSGQIPPTLLVAGLRTGSERDILMSVMQTTTAKGLSASTVVLMLNSEMRDESISMFCS